MGVIKENDSKVPSLIGVISSLVGVVWLVVGTVWLLALL